MVYYVYILHSNLDGTYYTGSCKNIQARLQMHNAGNVRSTRNRRPWQIVHQETYNSHSEAVRRERQVKSWKKRAAIERLFKKK
ncbi:MAG: GIY-YIG nuclease family protein [Patescibacteria group bacterium]